MPLHPLPESAPISIPKKCPTAPRRLLVNPHAGGTFISYLPLVELLAPEYEVIFTVLPGRIPGSHFNWPSEWRPWVEHLTAHLLDDRRPLSLFGHSFGGLMSVEVLREFDRQGKSIEKIFLSSINPHRDRERNYSALPENELLEKMERLNESGMKNWNRVNPSVRQLIIQTLRADFKMIETTPSMTQLTETVKQVPIFVSGGIEDPHISENDLQAWKNFLNVTKVNLFPGGHFWLLPDLKAASDWILKNTE